MEKSEDFVRYSDYCESLFNSRGYIYVIQDYYGNCKIGCSDNPKSRFKKYISENAHPLTVVSVIQVKNKLDAESRLHKKFNNKRIYPKREWFVLNDDDIKFINSLDSDFYL